jgi:peptidoglycan/LPS O-acetylase OafA/YrhL
LSQEATPSEGTGKPLFFGGLTELRAIAAAAVVVSHIEYLRKSWGLQSGHAVAPIANLGTHGVTLFFCLSGFLITSLLSVEQARTGRIDIRRFYLRRALRIWPLYFLTLALGLVVAPVLLPNLGFRDAGELLHTHYPWLLAFMLPNLAIVRYGSLLGLSVLWSVGVEEQFYAVWPWVVRRFHRILARLLAAVLLLAPIVRCCLAAILPPEAESGSMRPVLALARLFPVESLAAGALLALIIHRGKLWSRAGATIVACGVTLLCLLWLWFAAPYHPLFHLGSALLWSALLAVVVSRGALRGGAGALLQRVGEVSYGVYLYHTFVIAAVLLLLRRTGLHDGLLHHVATYLLVFGATFALSSGSYRWFETPFLQLKERFAVVASSARAKPASPRG